MTASPRSAPRSAARRLALGTLGGVGLLALGTAAAGAGWLLYSRVAVPHDLPLPEAIPAPRKRLRSSFGELSYYADERAPGRALLLVHSVNAAASAYEMRPLFERFRGTRPVYALELPGFGFSERRSRRYSAPLYADAILAFVRRVLPEPPDVVALSLAGEFVVRAALLEPARFRSLALLSPTGLSGRRRSGSERLHRFLKARLWRRALFDLISTAPSIRYFLRRSFVGEPPQGLLRYSYLTSHQPEAEHAPLAFLSGKLFTPEASALLYERSRVPTIAIYD